MRMALGMLQPGSLLVTRLSLQRIFEPHFSLRILLELSSFEHMFAYEINATTFLMKTVFDWQYTMLLLWVCVKTQKLCHYGPEFDLLPQGSTSSFPQPHLLRCVLVGLASPKFGTQKSLQGSNVAVCSRNLPVFQLHGIGSQLHPAGPLRSHLQRRMFCRE